MGGNQREWVEVGGPLSRAKVTSTVNYVNKKAHFTAQDDKRKRDKFKMVGSDKRDKHSVRVINSIALARRKCFKCTHTLSDLNSTAH